MDVFRTTCEIKHQKTCSSSTCLICRLYAKISIIHYIGLSYPVHILSCLQLQSKLPLVLLMQSPFLSCGDLMSRNNICCSMIVLTSLSIITPITPQSITLSELNLVSKINHNVCSVKSNTSCLPKANSPPMTTYSTSAPSTGVTTHSMTSTPRTASLTTILASIPQRSHNHNTPTNNLQQSELLSQTVDSQSQLTQVFDPRSVL